MFCMECVLSTYEYELPYRDRERDVAGGLMSIGTIFVEFAPYFQIYTDFVKKFETSSATLRFVSVRG